MVANPFFIKQFAATLSVAINKFSLSPTEKSAKILLMVFRNIAKDKYLRSVAGLSLLILILALLIFNVKLGAVETPLILHFDAYKGVDFLGSKVQIYGILLSALVMILINSFLADFLYKRERFLSFIFVFVSLVLSILILMAISVIISVN
jgi:hypothetical protein